MGKRNYLIEGVSGAGKTTLCDEFQRRGFNAVHGDRELAYQGDPITGERLEGRAHGHHIWDVGKVRSLVADNSHEITFFCGGSRNFPVFIDLFDAVFILEVDEMTVRNRVAGRGADEFGGNPGELDMLLGLLATRQDLPPDAISINATLPVTAIADNILARCGVDCGSAEQPC